MRAVILAGGQGTRLRPYTTVIPKPLIPVGDRPILAHILAGLGAAGVRKIDLCVSHLGELIQLYFTREGVVPDGVETVWHWEDEPLGTAGALKTVPDLDEPFIAMNGDILTSLDYSKLFDFHLEHEAALTIAMRPRAVRVELGVVETENNRVVGYREKPTLHYDVSMGVYVYEPRALAYLPDGPCQFPDLVLRLLEAGEHVAAFRSDADWYDIGTLEEYERAMADTKLFAGDADDGAPPVNPAAATARRTG